MTDPVIAIRRRLGLVLLGAGLLLVNIQVEPAWSQSDTDADTSVESQATEPVDPGLTVDALRKQAKDLGAKSQLPLAWRALDEKFKQAEDTQADAATWSELEIEARRLLNAATFVDRMRRQKSAVEATLSRFDQALAEIAALYGLKISPVLTGPDATNELLEKLSENDLRRQVLVDSLTVQNRFWQESVGGKVATQDSLITSLQLEVSSLRHRLWETELRAGVAEADRTAAESVLSRKQQREASITEVMSTFTPEEGEALLTADNEIVLRVHGTAFAVGSASLQGGQDALLEKIAGCLQLFPQADYRIEGHTDDTGSRQANLRLSRRRAETVARWLESRLGWPEGRIGTEGFGPDRPVALNATPEGRALNRRIDVVITLLD